MKKMLKKTGSLIFALLCFGVMGCQNLKNSPEEFEEEADGQGGLNSNWVRPTDEFTEGEDAFAAVKNMWSGVNLSNGFDSTSYTEGGEEGWILKYTDKTPRAFETAWGQPRTSQALISGIKELGFNAVRVPVTWAEHIDSETYKIEEAWMNRVKEVVDWIISEDMYCLLNTHHDGGTAGWVEASDRCYEKYKDQYVEVYRQIAETFKDYNGRLILCGTNEMISANDNWGVGDAEAQKVVNQWNQLFVDTVRASGGNNAQRNLLVGTYCCSTEEGNLLNFIKPKDSTDRHLIMEVHIYSPKGFVWEKASWISDWGTKWQTYWEGDVKAEFNRIKKYADKYEMPVIIGEWGTLGRRFPSLDEKTKEPKWEAMTDTEGAKFTGLFIKESRNLGFTSFYWDTQEIVDRATGNVTSPLMMNGIRENY